LGGDLARVSAVQGLSGGEAAVLERAVVTVCANLSRDLGSQEWEVGAIVFKVGTQAWSKRRPSVSIEGHAESVEGGLGDGENGAQSADSTDGHGAREDEGAVACAEAHVVVREIEAGFKSFFGKYDRGAIVKRVRSSIVRNERSVVRKENRLAEIVVESPLEEGGGKVQAVASDGAREGRE
jgi:hypothetical protein